MESYQLAVVYLCDLSYQERLRDAAKERPAAAQRRAPWRGAWLKMAPHVAGSWLRKQMLGPSRSHA